MRLPESLLRAAGIRPHLLAISTAHEHGSAAVGWLTGGMEIRTIRYFLKVVDMGPVSVASRALHAIAEPKDQRANRPRHGSKGGRPIGFDSEI
ncbi:hypothetical protein Sgleb_75580 [Streptomyces glebosus]|uniref:Uncharacterized protein n=2 Tax=Streptomyces glebosus TaxID=249580 RepID=A0A640TAJ8_9ACTN|nr:hypothetical protein Sgleb_75580 [Streptomyces glebosus]GHG63315.1 hypothetical protein GCM10010513_30780 [Streptomyces glebosus]